MNQQKPTKVSVLQNKNKYAQGRAALLCVVILSVVNLLSVILIERYFLFSSYITQIFAVVGASFYIETKEILYPIIAGVIGLITVVPYFLCYLFSKKRVGWMIAALVLFSLDSVVFLIDFVSLISAGDVSMLFDIVIRAWVLVSLALGVKYGLRVKNDEQEAEPESVPTAFDYSAREEDAFDEMSTVTRTVTVSRVKSFVACAIKLSCCVNGKPVEELKNGETKTVQIDGRACELAIMAPNGAVSNVINIPAGYDNKRYTVKCKTGFDTVRLILEEATAAE